MGLLPRLQRAVIDERRMLREWSLPHVSSLYIFFKAACGKAPEDLVRSGIFLARGRDSLLCQINKKCKTLINSL